MKLNKAKKRLLIWTSIIILLIASVFALLEWLMGAGHDAIVKAFCKSLTASCGCALFAFTSILFNWPWKPNDDKD